jgi:predicted RecB family nuclease
MVDMRGNLELITKADWLTAGQCSTMGWRRLRAAHTAPNEADLFRLQQGQEIGTLARTLYPNGFLITKVTGKTKEEITRGHIASGTKTLFEATVLAAPFVAKADILQRQNGAWHILEVKSSFEDTSNIKALIDDLAYTVMVFKRGGLAVSTASLVLLSRAYRFSETPARLFDIIDKTEEVLPRTAEFEKAADFRAQALLHDKPPGALLVSACRACDYFGHQCLGAGLAHTVLELPGLHDSKLRWLSAAGIIDLSLAPDDLELNDRQERAKNGALSGKTLVGPGLAEALEAIPWPCRYLDFETVATVLPLYEGHGCHQQVLTQFSIHYRDRVDAEVRHYEYLADASRDCQRELAEALIVAMASEGSIIVYSNFEQTRIKALQDRFPDLNAPLQAILDRLVDLHSLVADYVYHPGFRGSFSIKKVLPALVPTLSYKDLAICDGDTAITRFARMARGEISSADIETTRGELLEYCKLDTLAMVRLHEILLKMAT